MKWKGVKVNITNYQDVFKDYSVAVREVVRGAILDDTPLGKYIDRYKDNPYLLWQVKMALDVGVEGFWLENSLSGEILEKIIDMVSKGINIEPLKPHFSCGLNAEYLKYIMKWYNMGISLDGYDFSIVQKDLLSLYDRAFESGVSMRVYNTGIPYSQRYLNSCIVINSNGRDVSKFLDGKWDEETITLIAKYSRSKYYEKYIVYIKNVITPSVAEELFECCKIGIPLDEISKISDGVYVYSAIHLSYIRSAYLSDLDYTKLLNPNYSIDEVLSIISEMEYNSRKKVSGRLRKK